MGGGEDAEPYVEYATYAKKKGREDMTFYVGNCKKELEGYIN